MNCMVNILLDIFTQDYGLDYLFFNFTHNILCYAEIKEITNIKEYNIIDSKLLI